MEKGKYRLSAVTSGTSPCSTPVAVGDLRPLQSDLTSMGIFSRSSTTPKGQSSNKQKPLAVHLVSSSRLTEYANKSPRLVEAQPGQRLTMAVQDISIPPAPDPKSNPAAYLRSIYAVRQRSRLVFEKVKSNSLEHFHVDLSKFGEVADYVVSIIKVTVAADHTVPA